MTDTLVWPSPPDLTELPKTSIEHETHSWTILGAHEEDHIFATIRDGQEFYESRLLKHLAQFLEQSDYVVDVGANIGNHTVWFAGVLGCRVRSFEPVPETVAILAANVQLNGLDDRVCIEPYGVGADRGQAEVARYELHNTGATRLRLASSGSLPVIRLDDLTWDAPVSLLKVDVEGMEPLVLEGARELIHRDRPILVLEVQDSATNGAVRRWLSNHEYLVLASFNATPTLVAVPRDEGAESTVLAHVASSLEQLGARFDDFEHRLDRLARYSKSLAGAGSNAQPSPPSGGHESAVVAALRRRIDELENTVLALHDDQTAERNNSEDR